MRGIGHARNLAVAASGEAVIEVGGSWGRLAEVAFALRLERPVVSLGHEHAPAGVPAAGTPAEAVERALALLGESRPQPPSSRRRRAR